MSKKKGTGWKHPKTGVWWKSKKGYHKYWEKYIKPGLKNKHKKESEEDSFNEDDDFNIDNF